MKHQYFGDINDYKKYGLLRALTRSGKIETTVCWMLTDSDSRNDGGKTSYINNPLKWKRHDPALFDALAAEIKHGRRDVKRAEKIGILPRARYYSDIICDDAAARSEHFAELWSSAHRSGLIFFDPDNGLEVKSVQKGKRGSSKYIYWDEVVRSYTLGYSLLIYQHFPRINRKIFIRKVRNEISNRLNTPQLIFFETSFVLFILIPQKEHLEIFNKSIVEINKAWNSGEKPLLKICR
jgi:hypothetical protein